jgi:hypothetical protein
MIDAASVRQLAQGLRARLAPAALLCVAMPVLAAQIDIKAPGSVSFGSKDKGFVRRQYHRHRSAWTDCEYRHGIPLHTGRYHDRQFYRHQSVQAILAVDQIFA